MSSEKNLGILGKASETLAKILQSTGKHSFDLRDMSKEDVTTVFLGWATHILDGSPPPGQVEPSEQRDWTGLSSFYNQHRESEAWFVESSLKETRELIWIFFKLISSNLARTQTADLKLVTQLDKLRKATTSRSLDELRQAALEAVSVLNEVSQSNSKIYRDQMRILGDRLKILRKQLEDAKKQLAIDPLTRMYNRKALDEHLEKAKDISQFSGKPTSLMMIDIDHFKKVNDNWGHQAGDTVLVRFAKLLIQHFPRKTDFVARYGGEEFAVVLEEDGLVVAQKLAAKLIEDVSKQDIDIGTHKLKITISIGISGLTGTESTKAFIERADKALYSAKNQGRNRYVVAEGNPGTGD